METCIPREYIDKISKLDLVNMTSQERVKAFSDILGVDASDINLLYEKSRLLKNQKTALSKFIDNISGVSIKTKAELKQKLAQRKLVKQDIINDEELLSIVKDTLDRKYDINIPDKAVEDLFRIQKEIESLKSKAVGTPDGSESKLAWGKKVVEYSDIVDNVKNKSDRDIIQIIKESLEGSKTRILEQKLVIGKVGQTIKEIVEQTLGLPAKGIKAAWDASYIFRQGLKVLTADPKIWGQQSKKSLGAWKKVFNKELMKELSDAFKADIVTRDLYQDAIKSKLAVGVVEDFFPTNISEKIPGIGNLFKASDDSFTMFSQGTRMDLFEKYVKQYMEANSGNKPSREIMDSMASYVNGLTGRGNLGKAEAASSWLNQLFFSARYQVANLKTFTDPLFAKTPEVQRIAAKNLAKHAGVLFGTMTALSALTDVGFDPRDKTFGKAKIPGTKKWVDVTGGLGSYLSTLGQMYDKVTGKPKYGEDTAMDILIDFGKGKLAPIPGAARDYLEQRNYDGDKPTVTSVLRSLFVPINADNAIKSYENNEEEEVMALQAILETIGFGVSQPKKKKNTGSPLNLILGE